MEKPSLIEIEKELRRLPFDKLLLLRLFTGPEKYISSASIASKLSVNSVELGGKVSSLVRTTISGIPLILPVGKHERQAILTLNEELISQENLKILLKKIGI